MGLPECSHLAEEVMATAQDQDMLRITVLVPRWANMGVGECEWGVLGAHHLEEDLGAVVMGDGGDVDLVNLE